MNPMVTTNQKPTTYTWKLEEQGYTSKKIPKSQGRLGCSPWHVESYGFPDQGIEPISPCIARQILNYCHSGSSGKEILKNSFTVASKIKYWGMNLTQEVKKEFWNILKYIWKKLKIWKNEKTNHVHGWKLILLW